MRSRTTRRRRLLGAASAASAALLVAVPVRSVADDPSLDQPIEVWVEEMTGLAPEPADVSRTQQRRSDLRTQIQAEQRKRHELLEQLVALSKNSPVEPAKQRRDHTRLLDPHAAPTVPEEHEPNADAFDDRLKPGQWDWTSKVLLVERVLDANRDGQPEEIRYIDPDTGMMIRKNIDRNYDGRMDAWHNYVGGALVLRIIDTDYDDVPDVHERYAGEVMTHRHVDRDQDGVLDALYIYHDGELIEEQHDTDNDGNPNRILVFQDRVQTQEKSDRDGDGRIDTWIIYELVDGKPTVSEIHRDAKGRGRPDTFEIFEIVGEASILSRREEDLDGNGTVDVHSIYRRGRLVRREILDPEAASL